MANRPCWVEIDTQSLEDNIHYLRSLAGSAELLAVVKADAYGHGLALCAPAAERARATWLGATWLGVTCVDEGIAARVLCPEGRIVAMSGFFSGQAGAAIVDRITPVVWTPEQLGELADAAENMGAGPQSVPVHLEIDTGMSRQGAALEDLAPLLACFTPAGPLQLEGIVTHLFAADETDARVNQSQLARLERALAPVFAAGLKPHWLSVGASAALLSGEAQPIAELAARFGMQPMLRPGLSLYGIAPGFVPDEPAAVAAARARLKPVLAWKTRVTSVRAIAPGDVVGYNGTFVATEPMRVALLPVGYADGLDRRLGNRFSLLVRGQRAPLVGRISMDLAVIDVSEIDGVEGGDEVVIVGTQGDARVTVADHAEAAGTIPWEVFTRIAARVPRVAV